MPLHDWARVPANVFHSFHLGWLWTLTRALNGGLLPSGYQARAEEYLGPFPSDGLALETPAGAWWWIEAGPGSCAGTAHEAVFKHVARRLLGDVARLGGDAVGGPL